MHDTLNARDTHRQNHHVGILVHRGGVGGLALWHKEVARIPWLHAHKLPLVPKIVHLFQQDDIH
jgi:aminoglycoside phosphotransferase